MRTAAVTASKMQQECLGDVEHADNLWDFPVKAASEKSIVHC